MDGPANCPGVRGATIQVYAAALDHTGVVRSGQKHVCFLGERNALPSAGSRSQTAHTHLAMMAPMYMRVTTIPASTAPLYWPVPVARQRKNQIEARTRNRRIKAASHNHKRKLIGQNRHAAEPLNNHSRRRGTEAKPPNGRSSRVARATA